MYSLSFILYFSSSTQISYYHVVIHRTTHSKTNQIIFIIKHSIVLTLLQESQAQQNK